MKKNIIFLLVILMSSNLFSQDVIDPKSALKESPMAHPELITINGMIDKNMGFVRGWNWGSPAQDEPHFKSGVHL
jgi:hypothetical protein